MSKTASLFAFFSLTLIVIVIGNIVIAAQQPNNQPDSTIDEATKNQVIEKLLKDLNESYVFPDVAKKMEADIRSRLKNKEYEQITGAREFAKKLTDDLRSVSRDKHLGIQFSPRPIPERKERSEPTEEEKARNDYFMKINNYAFEKVEWLPGNIGYINLRGFVDAKAGAETVAAAMKFLANTDALVFDLRQNGGGSPEMVALISSYLFGDKSVHLNSLYWRQGDKTEEFWTKPNLAANKFTDKPVYVLTANRTFSAAEEFTYNLKNLKRATIVGETTGGGAHPGGGFRLSEHFSAFIPTGRAISPITKSNWEGTGVEPDVKVPKEQALKTAYLLALSKSLEKAENEEMKNALKQIIEKNQKELDEMKKTVATK